jgi:hypothetical protein
MGVTMRRAVDNIMDHWNRATPEVRAQGASWYPSADNLVNQLAGAYGLPAPTVAAVVAHLSPRTSWQRNIQGAREILAGGTAPYCLSKNRENAGRALAAPNPLDTFSPRAPKARAFARNILGDESTVTVDVWAMRIAMGCRDFDDSALRRQGAYEAVAHAYRLAAKRAGVTPAVMQATTWIVARNGRTN